MDPVAFLDSLSRTQTADATVFQPQGEVRSPRSELGMDDFLKLLTTQLISQDPLSPMDDTDFIAQMANFSSLTQMEIMAKNLESMRQQQEALGVQSLIGRYIHAETPEGERISGFVTHVEKINDQLMPHIDSVPVPYKFITGISNQPAGTLPEGEEAT